MKGNSKWYIPTLSGKFWRVIEWCSNAPSGKFWRVKLMVYHSTYPSFTIQFTLQFFFCKGQAPLPSHEVLKIAQFSKG